MKRFSVSKVLTGAFCLFLIAFFVLFPKEAAAASVDSCIKWATKIFPSLFTFAITGGILSQICGTKNLPFLKSPLNALGISSEGSGCYLMSFVCASPVSVKTVCEAYTEGVVSKDEAQILLVLCSTVSPLFLYSSLGVTFFGSKAIGASLAAINYISAFLSSALFKVFYPQGNRRDLTRHENKRDITLINIVCASVTKALGAGLNAGAFVVFFGILTEALFRFDILKKNNPVSAVVCMLVELSCGAELGAKFSPKFNSVVLPALFGSVGLGGASFLMQNISYITATDLSVKKFVEGKVINMFISAALGCACYLLGLF